MGASRRYRKRVQGRVLLVLPEIPDDLSAADKDALALRNIANRTGRCPSCGARFTTTWHAPKIGQQIMLHEEWCEALCDPPGVVEAVAEEMRKWSDG